MALLPGPAVTGGTSHNPQRRDVLQNTCQVPQNHRGKSKKLSHGGGTYGDVTAKCPGTEGGHGTKPRESERSGLASTVPLVVRTTPARRADGAAAGATGVGTGEHPAPSSRCFCFEK